MIPKQLQVDGINFVLIEKGCKKPFQLDWQKKEISFNNKELMDHIRNGGNYGVRGGGDKNLLIVDFDNKDVQTDAISKLPETFTIKTGSGMLHFYYFSNEKDSFKGFDEQMNTLFDVQGEGKQGIGAGSLHPNGNKYELFNDKNIAFIDYSELKATLMQYDKKPKKKIEIKNEKGNILEDDFIDNLKKRVSVKNVLDYLGINTSKSPTQCPFHDSKGEKCLGFNDETAHCFHCEGSWNIISLIKESKKCSSKEAIEVLAHIGNMDSELEFSRKRYIEKLSLESNNSKLKILGDVFSLFREKKISEATEILVEYVKSNLFLYTTKDDKNSEMWVYKEGIYIPHGRSEVKEILRELMKEHYSSWIYNQVIPKIEIDTFIDIDEFFKIGNIYEVPVQNGILDIRERKLSQFTPSKIFFSKMPVIYNVESKCPKITQFLKDVLNSEDDIKVFFEVGGSCLLNEYRYEKAIMMVGNGRNGKDKTLELLKRMFGSGSYCSIPLSSLVPDSFQISELFGKRLNLAGEISGSDLKDTSTFKAVTGRSSISGKRKFLKDIVFDNRAKMIFACNELPMVYDISKGFWSRWLLFEFPFTFEDENTYNASPDKTFLKVKDPDIINKITLPDELSGLLNGFLEGYDRLFKNKGFSASKGTDYIKDMWIRKSNSFMAFCVDNLEECFDGKIPKYELRKKYSNYCKKHKVSGKSDLVIKRVLEEMFGACENRRMVGSNYETERVWEGIKWK